MSRRTRTLEILTAAGLVPGQLAIEQARGQRDARVAQALASLVPGIIGAGADIVGQVGDSSLRQETLDVRRSETKAKQDDVLERMASRNAKTADDAAKAAAKTKADEEKRARDNVVQQTRTQLAGGATPDGGRVGGISRRDLETRAQAAGMEADQLLQEADLANVAEMNDAEKAAKANAPKPGPSPEAIERQRLKDEDTRLSVEQRRRDLAGLKPLAPSDGDRKTESSMTSMETNVADLERDLDAATKDAVVGTGPVEGRLRDAFTFAFGDEGWSKFQSQAAAVNLQIFGSLRSDAPSEAENKQAEALKINSTDKPEAIKAKLRTIRALIKAKKSRPGSRLDQLVNGLTSAPTAPATTFITEDFVED